MCPSTAPIPILSSSSKTPSKHLVTKQRAPFPTLAALSEYVTFTDPDRALEVLREALTIAEARRSRPLGHVLLSYRLAGKTPGNADAGHPTANRLITLGRRTGHTPFVLHGFVQRAWTYREEGDLASADRAMSAARSFLGGEPAPIYVALFMLYRSSQLLLAGDLAGAEETANEVLDLESSGFDPPCGTDRHCSSSAASRLDSGSSSR